MAYNSSYTGAEIDAALAVVAMLTGSNTVTTLASLPIDKRSINATLSGATTISLASDMQVGQELLIRCVASSSFTQAIPNSGYFTSLSGASVSIANGDIYEISIWCYKTGYYEIILKQED